MSVIIVFYFVIGVLLIPGDSIHAAKSDDNYGAIAKQCAMYTSRRTYGVCILKSYGVINNKGEWSKQKLEDVMRRSFAVGGPPEGMITQYMQCVDEATGETVADKCAGFYDCLDDKYS